MYKRALGNGTSKETIQAAAFGSREDTLNFARGGRTNARPEYDYSVLMRRFRVWTV